MSLRGSLKDCSLPELFRLIDLGCKSGQLIVQTSLEPTISKDKGDYHYIWFRQGQVVAATNCLDEQDLMTLIENKGWLSRRVTERLRNACPKKTPFGLYLRSREILTIEQVNILFREQIDRIRNLFELPSGHFEMNWQAALPWHEMTGLGVKPLKIALLTLRTMHNWNNLVDLLPEATSALQPLKDQPDIQLEPLEWHLWEFADGVTPLAALVLQLNQPLIQIQRAAFRLIIAGLVEEIPVATVLRAQSAEPLVPPDLSSLLVTNHWVRTPEQPQFSQLFLQNLISFLWSKA